MNRNKTEQIRLLCKSVGPAKQTMAVARKDIEVLQQKLNMATTERMKAMIENAIRRRENENKRAECIVSSFMSAVNGLDCEERNVMIQLYSKQKKWTEIDSSKGVQLSKHEVEKIYRRAIRHMCSNAENLVALQEVTTPAAH